ncbi:alpha/beta fold hydrolase [Haliscomenobacter sp.]|uniref:alpha/beta fold hydrolase n=1 Tax=Haliscomenobacter sp. TaxID=2717303 RepID=UPI00359353CC
MEYPTIKDGKYTYIETKGGEETLILLHGLFGALSNFEGIIAAFGQSHNVVIPILPMFELPIREVSVMGLVEHLGDFIEDRGYKKVHLLGNSLGGHIALLYTLGHQDKIASLILTGSSGLFESAMGNSFPKRGDYEYIKKKTQDTFYDPTIASAELIDEVYSIVNDRNRAIRVIATSKSAVRHNLGDKLHNIKVPTLLIWGRQDQVTPAFVGEKFHEMIPHSRLHLIELCGHAPMMEKKEEFNRHLSAFLQEVSGLVPVSK